MKNELKAASFEEKHPGLYVAVWCSWALLGFFVMLAVQSVYGRSESVFQITRAIFIIASVAVYYAIKFGLMLRDLYNTGGSESL